MDRPARDLAPGLSTSLFAARGLSKAYRRGRAVLDAVDFDLGTGTILGLVGPNGAGKTTLLSVLSGILPQSSGALLLDGEPVDFDASPERRRDLGIVLGGMALIEELRPEEYFEFIAALNGVPRATASARAAALVERLGVPPGLDRRIRELSTGTRKKVELIAALLHEPRILLMDEPFEALDPPSAAVFTSVVREYTEARGAAAIVSSHILPWVEPLATEVRFLWDGRLYPRSAIEALAEDQPDAGELRAWAQLLAA